MNPGPRREVPAQQSWFIYDCEREASPFPGESRRFRVIGSNDLNSFRLGGFTDFKRLDAAAVTLTGKGFAGYARVLDWGCGCGRVARYASRLPEIAFTGCDIDGDNVAWCAKHLGGSFAATRIHPPLPFDAARFDFVYGVSVFTHLDTRFQDAWLDELQRVTAPGALLLVTTHGTTALDYAGLNPTDYQTLRTCIEGQGLYVSGHNTQIEGYSEDAGEYVNVFHDASYIRRHWGQWFDILSILPGYLYTHDLVVMRKRA
jgi:SAM-dependent methyltransferase